MSPYPGWLVAYTWNTKDFFLFGPLKALVHHLDSQDPIEASDESCSHSLLPY